MKILRIALDQLEQPVGAVPPKIDTTQLVQGQQAEAQPQAQGATGAQGVPPELANIDIAAIILDDKLARSYGLDVYGAYYRTLKTAYAAVANSAAATQSLSQQISEYAKAIIVSRMPGSPNQNRSDVFPEQAFESAGVAHLMATLDPNNPQYGFLLKPIVSFLSAYRDRDGVSEAMRAVIDAGKAAKGGEASRAIRIDESQIPDPKQHTAQTTTAALTAMAAKILEKARGPNKKKEPQQRAQTQEVSIIPQAFRAGVSVGLQEMEKKLSSGTEGITGNFQANLNAAKVRTLEKFFVALTKDAASHPDDYQVYSKVAGFVRAATIMSVVAAGQGLHGPEIDRLATECYEIMDTSIDGWRTKFHTSLSHIIGYGRGTLGGLDPRKAEQIYNHLYDEVKKNFTGALGKHGEGKLSPSYEFLLSRADSGGLAKPQIINDAFGKSYANLATFMEGQRILQAIAKARNKTYEYDVQYIIQQVTSARVSKLDPEELLRPEQDDPYTRGEPPKGEGEPPKKEALWSASDTVWFDPYTLALASVILDRLYRIFYKGGSYYDT